MREAGKKSVMPFMPFEHQKPAYIYITFNPFWVGLSNPIVPQVSPAAIHSQALRAIPIDAKF